ncbi:MAG: J domain-containing protein [Solirubrobacteraceae bacterium]
MDPHGVLGLLPGATPEDISATYRRLAKQWHPDRGGGRAAENRMAEINAAYDLLRATAWTRRHEPRPAPSARASGRGAWLPHAIRCALSQKLLSVLEPAESVWLVTPATTWASPQALLAASDRRLLWLLDDVVNGRVHTLRFGAIEAVEHSLRRPRRRVATLRVRAGNGRRFTFGELRPATAATLVARIREGPQRSVAT